MTDPGLFGDAPAADAPAGARTAAVTPPRTDPNAPLAARMRPRALDEVIGQQHLLGAGAPLRRLVHGGAPSSMLLYGPPGTGKTTLATLVAGATGRRFAQLSAIAAGVKEVRAVIDAARHTLRSTGEQTVLFIDEVHRFNKAQQDSLLGAVEDRTVILIGATTENPFFSVVSPLLSRSLILQLQPLTDDDIAEVLVRAVADDRGLAGRVTLSTDAQAHLVALSGGDARRSLTALEAAADSVLDEHPRATRAAPASVDLAAVERAVNRAAVRYDKSGDQHYDITSAFIKSMRGS
ncbi:MAG: AAA family ATPase, partial [Nakamurella sp.]